MHRAGAAGDLERHRLGGLEHVQGAGVSSALADRLLEALDGLDVVVEDVGACLHHRPQRRVLAVEVRDQDLHAHARRLAPKRADRLREDVGATVGQVVAGDARHDHVLQAHRADRLRDAARLVRVIPARPAGLHRAEPAGSGAGVAEDHDGGGALLPALADVRAARLLADRVEREATHEALEFLVVRARSGRARGSSPDGGAAPRLRPPPSRTGRRRGRSSAARPSDRGRSHRAARTSGARDPWRFYLGPATRSGCRRRRLRAIPGPPRGTRRLVRRRWPDGRWRCTCSSSSGSR